MCNVFLCGISFFPSVMIAVTVNAAFPSPPSFYIFPFLMPVRLMPVSPPPLSLFLSFSLHSILPFFFLAFPRTILFKLIFRLIIYSVLYICIRKCFLFIFPKAARPIYFRGPNMRRKVRVQYRRYIYYLPSENVENKY